MQHKAVYLLFCKFTLRVSGVNHIPSSVLHKTVTTASGTGHTSVQNGRARPVRREVAAQKLWPVPEAVVTVLCTPDYGCGWHPIRVAWACRIINRLLCVGSRWTIININLNFVCVLYTKFFKLMSKGEPLSLLFLWSYLINFGISGCLN